MGILLIQKNLSSNQIKCKHIVINYTCEQLLKRLNPVLKNSLNYCMDQLLQDTSVGHKTLPLYQRYNMVKYIYIYKIVFYYIFISIIINKNYF